MSWSYYSVVSKKMLTAQGVIMGALLMSIVWLVPSATTITTSSIVIPAAFATNGITCVGVPATIVGTEGNDNLVGTEGRDIIVALGGNDRVQALGGDDAVCGGD